MNHNERHQTNLDSGDSPNEIHPTPGEHAPARRFWETAKGLVKIGAFIFVVIVVGIGIACGMSVVPSLFSVTNDRVRQAVVILKEDVDQGRAMLAASHPSPIPLLPLEVQPRSLPQ
ncbi:hypothetical protein FRC12_018881 [Ceratobasidium sp. 428]|nr:hypothetical protein FRC12_018881 [Ceratobasidium sp. 428]